MMGAPRQRPRITGPCSEISISEKVLEEPTGGLPSRRLGSFIFIECTQEKEMWTNESWMVHVLDLVGRQIGCRNEAITSGWLRKNLCFIDASDIFLRGPLCSKFTGGRIADLKDSKKRSSRSVVDPRKFYCLFPVLYLEIDWSCSFHRIDDKLHGFNNDDSRYPRPTNQLFQRFFCSETDVVTSDRESRGYCLAKCFSDQMRSDFELRSGFYDHF
jgi:hypothetical protein